MLCSVKTSPAYSSQMMIQHFNLGTYGEGWWSPVEEKAVGQDHLLICTNSNNLPKKNKEQKM